MTRKRIPLADIERDTRLQTRHEVSQGAVNDYAELYLSGVELPPLTVWKVTGKFYLTDGFHRYDAALKAGFSDITCVLKEGTFCDALMDAVGSNEENGIRRTNADRRRAVGLALKEWPKLSDRWIAGKCKVSDKTVGKIRDELRKSAVEQHDQPGNSPVEPPTPEPETRIGRDGKERPAKRRAVSAPPEHESEPEEAPRVTAGAPEPTSDDLKRIEMTKAAIMLIGSDLQPASGALAQAAEELLECVNSLRSLAKELKARGL